MLCKPCGNHWQGELDDFYPRKTLSEHIQGDIYIQSCICAASWNLIIASSTLPIAWSTKQLSCDKNSVTLSSNFKRPQTAKKFVGVAVYWKSSSLHHGLNLNSWIIWTLGYRFSWEHWIHFVSILIIITLYLPVILRASLFNLLSVSLKLYFCFLSTAFTLDLNAPTPRLQAKWQ